VNVEGPEGDALGVQALGRREEARLLTLHSCHRLMRDMPQPLRYLHDRRRAAGIP